MHHVNQVHLELHFIEPQIIHHLTRIVHGDLIINSRIYLNKNCSESSRQHPQYTRFRSRKSTTRNSGARTC